MVVNSIPFTAGASTENNRGIGSGEAVQDENVEGFTKESNNKNEKNSSIVTVDEQGSRGTSHEQDMSSDLPSLWMTPIVTVMVRL